MLHIIIPCIIIIKNILCYMVLFSVLHSIIPCITEYYSLYYRVLFPVYRVLFPVLQSIIPCIQSIIPCITEYYSPKPAAPIWPGTVG